MLIKNRDIAPPDFWRYTHAETGYVSTAIDWYTWQENIAAHRKVNNLPPITPEDAEAQLCEILPPGNCRHAPAERKSRSWVNTRLRFGDIANGIRAYIPFMLGQAASQEEAERRARICSGCYLRVTPQGCGACVKIGRLITGDIAKKKTSYDTHLVNRACAICSCPVASLVHFRMSALEKPEVDSPEKQAAYPDFCWRKRGEVNYLSEAV